MSDPDRLDPARLSAAATYAVMFSVATGTLAQIAAFWLIAPVTEVFWTDPPQPPEDHSFPSSFPSYDLLSLAIACVILICWSPRLAKYLAGAGYPGLPAMLAVSMAVFALSFVLIYLPVLPFLSVMPEIAGGFLLNALHYAITYAPTFAAAFLSGARTSPKEQGTSRRGIPMPDPRLLATVLVVLWQFFYWPIWDSGNL